MPAALVCSSALFWPPDASRRIGDGLLMAAALLPPHSHNRAPVKILFVVVNRDTGFDEDCEIATEGATVRHQRNGGSWEKEDVQLMVREWKLSEPEMNACEEL